MQMKMTHLLFFSHAKINQMAFESDNFQLLCAMDKWYHFTGLGESIMVVSNNAI